MKQLDVNSVQTGIDHAVKDIDSFHEQISAIQRAIRDFYALEEALKGKGGDSIREFFLEVHQPFLIFLYQSLVDYKNVLVKMKEAVDSFESHSNGIVSQEFLEVDVENGFNKVETRTVELTDDANRIINRVNDLVDIRRIDDSEVLENVQNGKKKTKQIVEQLNELDRYETSLLQNTKDDLQTMNNYLLDIESRVKSGRLTPDDFDVSTIKGIPAYNEIKDGIYDRVPAEEVPLNDQTIKGLPIYKIERRKNEKLDELSLDGRGVLQSAFNDLENGNINRVEYLNILTDLQKFEEGIEQGEHDVSVSSAFTQYLPNKLNTVPNDGKKVKIIYKSGDPESGYFVVGNEKDTGEYLTVEGGVGYYENGYADLSNPDSLGKVGGSGKASLIYGNFDLESDIIDANFTNRILSGDSTAQVGGTSIFGLNVPLPLLKGEGKGYELHGRYQFDQDTPIIGGFGNEARGSAGNAKAYAGFDEASLGVAAKASLAEGELSQILPIPFTDVNVKLTGGASAGSIGGEAKVGKETLLDLRFIFGFKFGIKFE